MLGKIRKILKPIIFSLIPVVFFCFIGELVLRAIYYQKHSHYPFALISGVKSLQQKILMSIAQKKVRGTIQKLGLNDDLSSVTLSSALITALNSDEGGEIRHYLENKYETEFKKFLKEVDALGAKLLIVYLPFSNPNSRDSGVARNFFQTLANKYDCDFIDPSQGIIPYKAVWQRLLPEDTHFSRFGNQLLVEIISPYIDKYAQHRISFSFQERPRLFGDLKPNSDSIWEIKKQMPYRVVTNKQGLRMGYDLIFPKTKQRILALGDSGTFGPFLHNHDTFPVLLDRKYPNREVINAGISGYTITDELALFTERAKYVEPDIVILQVGGNDISDLFFFNRNLKGRTREIVLPSTIELQFLERVTSQHPKKF